MKNSLAVIGQGFVGSSLSTVFAERGFDVYTFDITGKCAPGCHKVNLPETCQQVLYPERLPQSPFNVRNVTELVHACEHESKKNFSKVYFVCLPTPMFDDGEADLSIVEGVLDDLSKEKGERIAVVKSTVTPGSTEGWNRKYSGTGLRVVFCPEFLTEANALDDMRNQTRIILGGPRPQINKVRDIFKSAFTTVPIIKTSSTTAEMVKYFTNIQLAARVVLSCELSQIVNRLDEVGLDIDYDKVVEYAKYDTRLGGSHMSVPGNDGIMGARGHCFPKDLAALIFCAQKLKLSPSLMEAIQKKNLELVKPEDRDWEKMVGRAYRKREK